MRTSWILFFLIYGSTCWSQTTANLGFELSAPGNYTSAGAVSGWSLSSRSYTSCSDPANWVPGSTECRILSTPVFSFSNYGLIVQSPLGGTNIANINYGSSNNSVTRLSSLLVPTNQNSAVQVAIAGIIESSTIHTCCDGAKFSILLTTGSGTLDACSSHTSIAPGCDANTIFSSSGTYSLLPWTVKTIDLSAYIGFTVGLEIIAYDCSCGLHSSSLLADVKMMPTFINQFQFYPSVILVEYCSGQSMAKLTGPAGYAFYQWYSASTGSIPAATNSVLLIQNAVQYMTFSLVTTSYSGCMYLYSSTIIPNQVSISSATHANSCVSGTSGSATVTARGSAAGYNYNWMNSNSVTVGTSSVVSGLSPGTYSVVITSANSSLCGISSTIVTIGVNQFAVQNKVQPFCGNKAYIKPAPGNNFRWYQNNYAIPAAMGGTLSSQELLNPVNGQTYAVAYTSIQGCADSIKYTLAGVSPGSINIISTTSACVGSSNGAAAFSVVPALSAPGPYTLGIVSTGSNTPFLYNTFPNNSSSVFTVSSLNGNGNYLITAFDGACTYSTALVAPLLDYDYLVSISQRTICPGHLSGVSIILTAGFNNLHFSYHWAPTTWLLGGNPFQQHTLIGPNGPPGPPVIMIYTITVSHNTLQCAVSKTIAITYGNPVTPTIAPIPAFCRSESATISAAPTGGSFQSSQGINIYPNGLMDAHGAPPGFHTVHYSNNIGYCSASASRTFQVKGFLFKYSGNNVVCDGDSTIMTATGATTYTWSNGTTGPSAFLYTKSTQSFSITAHDSVSGCAHTEKVPLTVVPLPFVNITGNTKVCKGSEIFLVANGAQYYSWMYGPMSRTFTAIISTDTVLIVSGVSSHGCASTISININPKPLPEIIIEGATDVCDGQMVKLEASGAATYTWEPGIKGAKFTTILSGTRVFSVSGRDQEGCVNSNTISITAHLCPATSINENLVEGFNIYPNPASAVLNISLPPDFSKVIISNVLGEAVLELSLSETSAIDVSCLAKGIYFVQKEGSRKTMRFIKQ